MRPSAFKNVDASKILTIYDMTPSNSDSQNHAKKGQWRYERKEGGRQEAGAANDALPHAAVSAELDLVASKNQMELLGNVLVI